MTTTEKYRKKNHVNDPHQARTSTSILSLDKIKYEQRRHYKLFFFFLDGCDANVYIWIMCHTSKRNGKGYLDDETEEMSNNQWKDTNQPLSPSLKRCHHIWFNNKVKILITGRYQKFDIKLSWSDLTSVTL